MINRKNLHKIAESLDKNYKTNKHLQQRGIGDLLEGEIIDKAIVYSNFIPATGKKSTGDFAFLENKKTALVDVKTNDINAKMSMPNLISMRKLLKILENDEDLFYMFVSYSVGPKNIKIEHTQVISIYDFDISKLSIGALGFGQLQIKNYIKYHNNLTKDQLKCDFISDIKNLYQKFITSQRKKWDSVECLLSDSI